MHKNSILKLLLKSMIIGLVMTFTSCGEKSSNGRNSSYYSEEDGYEDGTYCAEIDYYYSETGTNSTYTLEVEIENNELTVIHWPNGGWLDDSHFLPPDISDGIASFTSDRGVDYTVKIIGQEGDCLLNNHVTDEDQLIREEEEEEDRIRQQEEDDESDRRRREEDNDDDDDE